MRKPGLLPGDIVEVHAGRKRKGYVRVVRRDKFGLLLQLIGDKLVPPSPLMPAAYVNEHSIPKDWKVVDNRPIEPANLNLPTFFFGSSGTVWTVEALGGRRFIPATAVSFEELKRQGYVHQVLWLAKNIAEYFDGKPLEWPRPI